MFVCSCEFRGGKINIPALFDTGRNLFFCMFRVRKRRSVHFFSPGQRKRNEAEKGKIFNHEFFLFWPCGEVYYRYTRRGRWWWRQQLRTKWRNQWRTQPQRRKNGNRTRESFFPFTRRGFFSKRGRKKILAFRDEFWKEDAFFSFLKWNILFPLFLQVRLRLDSFPTSQKREAWMLLTTKIRVGGQNWKKNGCSFP